MDLSMIIPNGWERALAVAWARQAEIDRPRIKAMQDAAFRPPNVGNLSDRDHLVAIAIATQGPMSARDVHRHTSIEMKEVQRIIARLKRAGRIQPAGFRGQGVTVYEVPT